MKALSIKQPWATLIAKGYKDVENRTWDTKYRGKVLLHAGADKTYWRTVYDSYGRSINTICNELLYGNIEDEKGETYSAIVGYATLEDIVEDSDSIWAQADSKHWIFKDAYIFDEPIKAKGKLGLWDYPEITEEELPKAHKFERKYVPTVEGTTLFIPISNDWFEETIEGENLRLELTDEIEQMFFDEEGNFKEFTQLVLFSPTQKKTFEIKNYDIANMDENGEYITYIDEKGDEVVYECLMVYFNKSQA